MNDKELLELAAKAAGARQDNDDAVCDAGLWFTPDRSEVYEVFDIGGWKYWNPLTDDGDALRLAVKLGLCIICHATQVEYSKGDGKVGIVAEQTFRDAEATRRAIVRAAAEIGKVAP